MRSIFGTLSINGVHFIFLNNADNSIEVEVYSPLPLVHSTSGKPPRPTFRSGMPRKIKESLCATDNNAATGKLVGVFKVNGKKVKVLQNSRELFDVLSLTSQLAPSELSAFSVVYDDLFTVLAETFELIRSFPSQANAPIPLLSQILRLRTAGISPNIARLVASGQIGRPLPRKLRKSELRST